MPKRGKDWVAEFTKDWRRLQGQKWRRSGGVEARMLCSLAMWYGEHTVMQSSDYILTKGFDEDDKNRLSLVFNMVKKLTRKRIGHLYKVQPDKYASPNKIDPKSFDQADVVNQLLRALDFKCLERTQHWRRLWNLVMFGVAIEHTPWVENETEEPVPAFDPQSGELLWKDARDEERIIPQSVVEQEVMAGAVPEWFSVCEHVQTVGDVTSEIISPFCFFIDAGVKMVREMPHDQGCYILEIVGEGFIRDTFGSKAVKNLQSHKGVDLGIIRSQLVDKGPALSHVNMKDLVPAVSGSRGPDDPPMYLLATRYQPDCKDYPHGRRSLFVVGQEMLDDGEIPYADVPVTDFHYEPPEVGFWTPDFVTDLVPAQKFFNKRMSQTGESANATIYEILLLGGELGKKDIPTDLNGVVEDGIDEDGNPRVQALNRSTLPTWFLEATRAVWEWMERYGSSDLMMQQQFPGQIRGPLALPILQEIMDSEDLPLFEHMGEQLARVSQQRLNRVKEYYPPIRTLHFTGPKNTDEVLVFHKSEILEAGTDFTVTIDRATLVPELSAMRRARVIEDLSGPLAGLYTNRHTQQLDFSKIARALKYTDRDIEDEAEVNRKLARHFIARLWKGELIPPEIPYPFYDHNAWLDELTVVMISTEWLEASQPVRMAFIRLYEKCRGYLEAIQQAQVDAVESQMLQGAVAMATQQAAAKAAAVATDTALAQVHAQARLAGVNPDESEGDSAPAKKERKALPPKRDE